jgi:nicotinate-nucleotide pyrophosphorylase (carboxylating)
VIPPPLDPGVVREAVRRALEEDLGAEGDLTTDSVIPAGRTARGQIVARQTLVVAGLPWAREVFRQTGPELSFVELRREGEEAPAGEVLASVEGAARPILTGERTALNFLMRACGIATATRAAVQEVAGSGVVILDTRKTAPGLRALDKYAVAVGGGVNHRLGLFDAAMIKDTHRALVGSIRQAVARLLGRGIPKERITVEVRGVEELEEAIAAGAGRALLDNMDLAGLEACVRRAKGRIVLEASGGLRPGLLRPVAETGVDCLSLGYLTHSVRAADIALEIEALP